MKKDVTLRPVLTSKISRKILSRIFLVAVISLGIILIICTVNLWPKLKSDAYRTTKNCQDEIATQVNTYISNLDSAATFITASPEFIGGMDDYFAQPSGETFNSVELTLHELCSAMTNIKNVIVQVDQTTEVDSLVNISDIERDYFEQHRNDSSLPRYSSILKIPGFPTQYVICHMIQRKISNRSYRFFFFYNANTIVNTCSNMANGIFDDYCLVAPDGSILSADIDSFTLKELPENYSFSSDMESGRNGVYFQKLWTSTAWYMVSYSSNDTIYSSAYSIFKMVILFCIIFFLLTVLMLSPVLMHIIAPLRKLSKTMQKVSTENINIHSDIQTDDEIGDLSNVFNRMIDTIQEYITQKVAYEKKENQIIYNLLIAQIDSHFICNTMSIINSLARRGMDDKIIEANSALIKIIQNCLRVKTYKITDTLAQELDILQQYMIIEKLRYNNLADLIIEVPPELMQTEIPKNILQPIVENSFRHGLCNTETGEIHGTVFLNITYDEEKLYISVSDDGSGVSEGLLSILNNPEEYGQLTAERGKHIGLTNIYRRLKHIYQDQAEIHFSSDHGFTTSITIPLNTESEDI